MKEELSRALPLWTSNGGEDSSDDQVDDNNHNHNGVNVEEIGRLGEIVAEIFARDPLLDILRQRQTELDSMDIEG